MTDDKGQRGQIIASKQELATKQCLSATNFGDRHDGNKAKQRYVRHETGSKHE